MLAQKSGPGSQTITRIRAGVLSIIHLLLIVVSHASPNISSLDKSGTGLVTAGHAVSEWLRN